MKLHLDIAAFALNATLMVLAGLVIASTGHGYFWFGWGSVFSYIYLRRLVAHAKGE